MKGNSIFLYFFTLLISLLLIACHPEEPSRPNVLLILLDDLGYSDLGCYGGEIATPNIDALATNGQRFAGFYTSPMCAPTRAMLLSGNDNHIEGMGRMMNRKKSNAQYKGLPHYEEDISDRVVLFPKLLQQAGYYTCMAGKWHLGWKDSSDPYLHGFEDTWALRNGFANYYDGRNYGISEVNGRDTISFYTQNGQSVAYPNGRHATEVYTDKIINHLAKAKNTDKPFFAYLPYTAPHWPLQVAEKYSNPYRGKYDQGYQGLVQQRLTGLKEKGLIASDIQVPTYSDIPLWEDLSQQEQKIQARKMEIQAGLITHLDENIGRLVNWLKENRQYENTVIFLLSDNGAGAENFINHPKMRQYLNDTIINSMKNLGKPNSFATIGSTWAQVCSTPFKKYKGRMYEGGIKAPFIVSGYSIPKKEGARKDFFTVQDIAPTILEIAGITYPLEWNGKQMIPQRGTSIYSFLKNETEKTHSDDFIFAMEHRDAAMIRQGNWKLVNQMDAANKAQFELYDLSKDKKETTNVAALETDKVKELLEYWEDFKQETGVLFLRETDN